MSDIFYTIQRKNRQGKWDDWERPNLQEVPGVLATERKALPECEFRVVRSEVLDM